MIITWSYPLLLLRLLSVVSAPLRRGLDDRTHGLFRIVQENREIIRRAFRIVNIITYCWPF